MLGAMSSRKLIATMLQTLLVLAALAPFGFSQTRPKPPKSVRLYVFDCGTLHIPDIGRFGLKKEEVVTTDLSVACFLVVHPKGVWHGRLRV